MKIFRINPDNSCHSLLAADFNDYVCKVGPVFTPQPKAENWKEFGSSGPEFYVRDPAGTKKGNFFNFTLGALVFDDLVAQSAVGGILAVAGEILPAQLEGNNSPLSVCNVLTIYDCFDRGRSKFRQAGPVVVEVYEYVFLPHLIGDCSIFKAQVEQKTAIFTIADRGDSENEFYHQYMKSGFNGLIFQEIWNG
jgi:hypothetical protein